MPAKFIGPRDERGEPLSFVVGIPARDLTDEEISALECTPEELCASELYSCWSTTDKPTRASAPAAVQGEES